MGSDLDRMFKPDSIAVIGASTNPSSSGHEFVSHLLDAGYEGKLYPVSLRAEEVLGLPAYRSLRDIPGPVDYVISAVPASQILDLIDQCVEKKVDYLHLFTARFAETGDKKAADLEKQILEKARRCGIRLLGPNCLGIYYPARKISFADSFPKETGKIGAFLQSGGNSADLVNYGSLQGLRFSKVISYGNALDINEVDLLEYLAEDDETEIIAAYIEGLKQPAAFFELLRKTTPRKPVVILKGGRGNAGAGASSSHTAALSGSYNVWQAVMRQTNAIEARSMEELIDVLAALNFLPPVRGNRAGVAGGGGGMAVRTADEWEEGGFELPALPDDITKFVRDTLPSLWWNWIGNPLDVSVLPLEERAAGTTPQILRMMAVSPAYDFIVANFMIGGVGATSRRFELTSQQVSNIIEIAAGTDKPVIAVINAGSPGPDDLKNPRWTGMATLKSRLLKAGIPTYRSAHEAAGALRKVVAYYRKNRE